MKASFSVQTLFSTKTCTFRESPLMLYPDNLQSILIHSVETLENGISLHTKSHFCTCNVLNGKLKFLNYLTCNNCLWISR